MFAQVQHPGVRVSMPLEIALHVRAGSPQRRSFPLQEDLLSELFDLLKNRLDPDMLGAIAGRLGLGGDATGTAVSTALPALLGGMAHHAQTDEGATGLLDQVDATNGGASLDGLLDTFRGPATDEDAQQGELFGGMLGGGILDALTGRLGIGGPVVKNLLGMLGPIVIGSLGKLAGGSRLSPARLISLLTGGAGAAADAAPGGRAGLANMLGPIAGMLGLGGGAAATIDKVSGSVGNVVDTVAEREHATAGHGATAAGVAPLGPEDPMRKRGALGWIIGAAVLAAILATIFGAKSCGDDKSAETHGTTTTTTQTAPTAMGGGYSIMDGGDGKVTLHGTVPSEDARTAAIDGATAIFGDGNVTDELTVDTTAVTGPDAAAFGKVLTALKGAGSGWMAEVSGTDTLTLTGEVASDAAKSSLVKAVTAAFAPGTVVDKLTVAAASAEDTSAVEAINKEIRLRGVNFVTGSATLTGPSKTTLDRVAKLLTEAKTVRAEVQGHTDSQGDASANLALSSARAKAVVAYLVGKSIAADRLVAKGYGETTPIASNDTDAGRAKNRRVVFSVVK
jgi:outer membrane protein OmpA-like peptidoglycan-associated protein